jgi:hypothetical protein
MKQLIAGETPEETFKQSFIGEQHAKVHKEKEPLKEKWQPKEWRPEYQMVVILSTMNYDQKTICEIMAEKYNYEITVMHVSNILNTDKAKEIKAEILSKVEEKTIQTVEQNLEIMEQLAASRLVEMLSNDTLMMSNPFAVADRSLKILEGRQRLRTSMNPDRIGQQQNNFFYTLPPEIQARIDNGLKNISKVEELHGSKYEPEESESERNQRSGTDG